MARDFQDIQQLDSEENDHQLGRDEGPGTRGYSPRREGPFWKGMLPPQPLALQRLCSKFHLSLLVLAFNVLLLVAICVTGSQRAQLQGELQTLQETFSNFSSSTLKDILNLSSHGGFASDTVRFLEAKLVKQQQDLKADHATLLLHLKHFPTDLRTLTCQMAHFQSNGRDVVGRG